MFRAKLREVINLRVAVGLAFFAALYSASLHIAASSLHARIEDLLPLSALVAVAVWLTGVVWIAYRRWREMALPESELKEILTQINPDCCLVINQRRQVTMCNSSVQVMFGYTPNEVLGSTTDMLYFDRRPATDVSSHHIYEQLNRVGFHVGIAKGRHKNGTIMPLEIITGSIRHRKGAVLLLRDISKRVAAEEAHRQKTELLRQLEENYDKLQRVEKARDNLLHMIVHDMKNPLQVILSSMQLLQDEQVDNVNGRSNAYLDETILQTRRLIELVNSLLDINKLESGDLPLHLAECDLRVAVRRAISSVSLLAGSRAIEDFLPSDPVPVVCDSEIIHRVLVNLVSNAIHHTPDGTRISVNATPGDPCARVEVTDNGPGIPMDQQARIFEKFASSNHTFTRHHRSTGLGLPFCKLAVEAHGGSIGFQSNAGRGTTFWVQLPVTPPVSLHGRTETRAGKSS